MFTWLLLRVAGILYSRVWNFDTFWLKVSIVLKKQFNYNLD